MISEVSPLKGIPTNSQYSVGSSTPILVAPANTSRKSITYQNQGAVTIFLGFNNPNVTGSGSNLGYALFAGTTFTDNATNTSTYALAASSSAALYVMDVT